MIRILIITLCCVTDSFLGQDIDFKDFYRAVKNEAEISWNIPGFLPRLFIDKSDYEGVGVFLKSAKNYKILVFNQNLHEIKQNFNAFVSKSGLKMCMRSKEASNIVSVYASHDKNRISEIVLNIQNNIEELVLIGLKTNITEEEFSSLLSSKRGGVAWVH